jgi:transcriptional repressor NrdR
VDSRITVDGVRRRRLCNGCRRRFTTDERVRPPNVKVVKRNGRTEPFDSDRLVRVLQRVGRGRPLLSEAELRRLARVVEAELIDSGVRTVSSAQLVARLLDALRAVDRVAYDRLAANYLDEHGQLRIEPRPADTARPEQLGLFEDGDED